MLLILFCVYPFLFYGSSLRRNVGRPVPRQQVTWSRFQPSPKAPATSLSGADSTIEVPETGPGRTGCPRRSFNTMTRRTPRSAGLKSLEFTRNLQEAVRNSNAPPAHGKIGRLENIPAGRNRSHAEGASQRITLPSSACSTSVNHIESLPTTLGPDPTPHRAIPHASCPPHGRRRPRESKSFVERRVPPPRVTAVPRPASAQHGRLGFR